MPVKLAAGPTLKSTVNLPSESKNGDPGQGYDEINHQKRSVDDHKINGFNFLQSIKEDDKEEPDNREDDLEEEEERSDSCSIGECSSAEDETREDEVESKQTDLEIKSSLSSLDSLEESLPIKRGLSNFYSGKSKSFTSLLNAANATAKDLVKPENPLNKRRRLLIAWSRNRRASCSSLVSIAESSLMPLQLQLLPPVVSECDEEEEGEESLEQDDESLSSSSFSPSERMRRDKEKRRPSLFTVTIAPAQVDDHDHNPGLSSISISKMALRSPGRSLSLSDLSRHAHVHAMTSLD